MPCLEAGLTLRGVNVVPDFVYLAAQGLALLRAQAALAPCIFCSLAGLGIGLPAIAAAVLPGIGALLAPIGRRRLRLLLAALEVNVLHMECAHRITARAAIVTRVGQDSRRTDR